MSKNMPRFIPSTDVKLVKVDETFMYLHKINLYNIDNCILGGIKTYLTRH